MEGGRAAHPILGAAGKEFDFHYWKVNLISFHFFYEKKKISCSLVWISECDFGNNFAWQICFGQSLSRHCSSRNFHFHFHFHFFFETKHLFRNIICYIFVVFFFKKYFKIWIVGTGRFGFGSSWRRYACRWSGQSQNMVVHHFARNSRKNATIAWRGNSRSTGTYNQSYSSNIAK